MLRKISFLYQIIRSDNCNSFARINSSPGIHCISFFPLLAISPISFDFIQFKSLDLINCCPNIITFTALASSRRNKRLQAEVIPLWADAFIMQPFPRGTAIESSAYRSFLFLHLCSNFISEINVSILLTHFSPL